MLQFRRFASLLLGAWLAGSIFMDVSAVQNFKAVDRFLADPGLGAVQIVHNVGKEETRTLLRRVVAEQNRFYFEHWEWCSLGLGLSFLLLLVFGARPPKVSILLSLVMLAIILTQRVALTPEITKLGRALDFVSASLNSPEKQRFWMLHGIYSGAELLKLTIGFSIAGLLIIRRNPDRQKFVKESELDELPAGRQAI